MNIIIIFSILTGALITCFLYCGRYKFNIKIMTYYTLCLIFSFLLARFMHWYCHMEQYDSFLSAFFDYNTGSFILSVTILPIYIIAILFKKFHFIKSAYTLLDCISPAVCYIFAVCRLSCIFTLDCLGKYNFTNTIFSRFPFAIQNENGSYYFASFIISSFILFAATIYLIYNYVSKHRYIKGRTFHLFLVIWGCSEIFIDSTRYDASHLYFPTKLLADLNKGAGFIGFSQIVGAICCLLVMLYYSNKYFKNTSKRLEANDKYFYFLWFLFALGVIIAGTFEYVVQRHSSWFVYCYIGMFIGLLFMIYAIRAAINSQRA